MKPENLQPKIHRLQKIAEELVVKMDEEGELSADFVANEDEADTDEIKRIVINLLNGQEISTPELRRYFHLSNSEIWSIMSQLEREEKIKKKKKIGRAQYWTAAAA